MLTRILLADDHRIVRQGVRALLQRESSIEIVAEASDGPEAVRLATALQPDVTVMDVRMPNLSGVEATRQIVARCPRTKVIGLSGDAYFASGADMLRAGAMGFVVKDAAVDELVAAIAAVRNGDVYTSPAITGAIMTDYLGQGPAAQRRTGLSRRENEVLRLVAGGRSTKQAACDLSVSVKTIETHRRNLMEKLQLDNVADLTKYAIRTGLSAL